MERRDGRCDKRPPRRAELNDGPNDLCCKNGERRTVELWYLSTSLDAIWREIARARTIERDAAISAHQSQILVFVLQPNSSSLMVIP